MEAKTGLVVRAAAGRDKGRYFVILQTDGKYVMIADGKTRRLSSPKKKNIAHISLTKQHIDTENLTDKKLRMALKQFSE